MRTSKETGLRGPSWALPLIWGGAMLSFIGIGFAIASLFG